LKTVPAGQGKSVNPRVLAAFFSQLADLLQAGVPLLRSLELLERQTSNPALSFVLKDVRATVSDGTGLAQSMGKHPKVFGELAVSMVLAGQEGGFLEDVLRRIADFTEQQEDLKAKVIGALAYPAVLAGLGIGRVTDLRARSDIETGQLVQLLSNYQIIETIPIFAAYKGSRLVPPKIRAFVSFLQNNF
jgi:type II secretory pathway component PulF